MLQNSLPSTVSFTGINPTTKAMAQVMTKHHRMDRRQSTRSFSRAITVARAIIRVSM